MEDTVRFGSSKFATHTCVGDVKLVLVVRAQLCALDVQAQGLEGGHRVQQLAQLVAVLHRHNGRKGLRVVVNLDLNHSGELLLLRRPGLLLQLLRAIGGLVARDGDPGTRYEQVGPRANEAMGPGAP